MEDMEADRGAIRRSGAKSRNESGRCVPRILRAPEDAPDIDRWPLNATPKAESSGRGAPAPGISAAGSRCLGRRLIVERNAAQTAFRQPCQRGFVRHRELGKPG